MVADPRTPPVSQRGLIAALIKGQHLSRESDPHQVRGSGGIAGLRRCVLSGGQVPGRHRSVPLIRHMLMLIAAVTVPLMALGAGTLWLQYTHDRDQAEAQLIEHARTIARLVDGEFERAATVARTLAASTALARNDLTAFELELRAAAANLSSGAPPDQQPTLITLLDADGFWRLNTAWPPGARRQDVPASPTMRAVVMEGRMRFSDLVAGLSTGLPLVAVGIPLFEMPRDAAGRSAAVGAIGVTVPRERFIPIVAQAGLPSGAVASVHDRNGVTVARSFRDAETMGRLPMPGVLKVMLDAEAGLVPIGTPTQEGVPSAIAFAHGSHSGFIVKLDVPETVFLAPFRHTLILTAGIGALMLAGGLILSSFAAHRIVVSFRRVTGAAAEGAATGGTLRHFTGLREADELAAILAESLAERDQAVRDARALIDSSPVGVAIGNLDGRVFECNDAYLSITGCSRADIERATVRWDSVTPDEWRARDTAAVAEAAATGRCVPYEKECQRPDGTRVPVLVSFGLTDAASGLCAGFVVDLANLRAAEAARRESEAYATSILAATSDSIVVLNAEGRLAFMNEPGRVQHEIDDLAPLIGTPFTSLWPRESAGAMRVAQQAARTGQVARCTAFGPTAKGMPKWWDVTVSPLEGMDGGPARLLVVARDVTEARQAAADQVRQAERQEMLLRIADAMLANQGDKHALAMLVSDNVAEHLGIDVCLNYRLDRPSGTLQLVAASGIPEEYREAARVRSPGEAFCGMVAVTGQPLVADAVRIAHDEQAAFIRETGARCYACNPLVDSNGQILGTFAFASTGRDDFPAEETEFLRTLCHFVSLAWQRYRAEAALRQSEAHFRVITDAMPQMVWSTRPDGFHDYYNQRWYQLTGTAPQETEGEGWVPVFHPDDRERARAIWRHSLATGEPYDIEYRLRMADGDYRWMLGRALPVRDERTGAISRWFGTCTDIHETVAARETLARSREELGRLVSERTRELQAAQERLAHAQRMEALGQLAGGIAHDFNNILQAVQGGTALIERRPADAEAVVRLARVVLDAAERGAAITRRLLYFSRRGDLRAEPVDPVALQTGVREILRHTMGGGIEVGLNLEPDLPPLLADKGQLETVLINLAANGRDGMAGMGLLTLTAARETLRSDQAIGHPAQLNPGSYVRLSVSDTGSGMDAATLARATDPFFTTKPVGQGTGLGLAMARGFAEQSGGGLHIASVPGLGTAVTMWFPVAKGAAHAALSDAEPAAGALVRRANARLLLIDDDAIVREVMAEQMEAAGFVVMPAGSADAALALIDSGETVDLIVSDLSMPDMNGLELIREAQRRRPGLPAVLLTGFASNGAEIAVDGAGSGAFSLLRKPITGRHLVERITALLDDAATQ
jgi:PAS domain S-box-containing protein